jgi:hypothetical protein
MFRIFGTVTIKETGERVPNLVVAAFETDGPEFDLDRLAATTGKTWADRIGSVLTDTNGRFELEFETAEFQRDQEARPDLVILVLAPEDSRSVKEPSPLTPRERNPDRAPPD